MLPPMDTVEPLPSTAGRLLSHEMRLAMRTVQQGVPVDTGGGASLTKALVLGDLVVAHDLRRIVELGVYRGRLLLPLGQLLTSLGRGEATGIDPYTAENAVQTDDHARVNGHGCAVDLRSWPFEQHWEGIYAGVLDEIARAGIGDHTRVLREPSQDAAARFDPGSIDLLHVDGNHDAAAVTADLTTYLPLIRRGGFVVLDDASWPSVSEHCRRLTAQQRLVFSLFDGDISIDGVGGNDFAVFEIVNDPTHPA
jgi:hypothetical protein